MSSDMDPKLAQDIVEAVGNSLVASGEISEDEMQDRVKFLQAIKRVLGGKVEVKLVVDHTGNIRKRADDFLAQNEFNFARMFYATYFEHKLNGLIELYCIRNKFDSKTKKQMIRSLNIDSKLGWFLVLMGYSSFNDNHRKVIQELFEARNIFIHYKWEEGPDEDRSKSSIKKEFVQIKKAAKYMEFYCSKQEFGGKKSKLSKLLRKN